MAIHKPNLLSHLDRDREEGGQSLMKILFLLSLTLGSAIFLSFALSRLAADPTIGQLVWFFTAAALFFSWFLLSVLLMEDFLWVLLSVGLSLPGFFVFFSKDISLGFAAGVIAFTACLYSAASAARREEKTFTKIRIFRLAGIFFPRVFLGLALYLSAVFYFVPAKGELVLTLYGFEKAAAPIEKIVRSFYPDWSAKTTIGELAAKELTRQFSGAPAGALNAAVSETVNQLGGIAGIPLKPEYTVTRAIYDILFKRFTESGTPFLRYLPVLSLILSFFFVIRWLAFPLGWAASSLTYLFYLLLLSLNFVNIDLEGTSREVVTMK